MFAAAFGGLSVIVSCPSCGVRYRVDTTTGDSRGRCAGCGGVVPLVSAPRSYVLRQATALGATWGEGGQGEGVAVATPPAASRKGAMPAQATAHSGSAPRDAAVSPPQPYDPWAETGSSEVAGVEIDVPSTKQTRGRAGSPLLPALLAVVGALLGYWAGLHGFLGELPIVSAAGPAGLAVLGASLGLLLGWAGDRWTASQ